MFTGSFVTALFERAIKTFAQALAALLVADGTGILETNWGDNLSVSGMAALVSVLTTVASGVATGTASAVRAEIPADQAGAPEPRLP